MLFSVARWFGIGGIRWLTLMRLLLVSCAR
uniref:Uncharacterized protein n=1 Tax=Arundo donax TaxID=35708 RepID=A0A0A8YIX3_ARUDO